MRSRCGLIRVVECMQPENGLFVAPFKGGDEQDDGVLFDLIPFLEGEETDRPAECVYILFPLVSRRGCPSKRARRSQRVEALR